MALIHQQALCTATCRHRLSSKQAPNLIARRMIQRPQHQWHAGPPGLCLPLSKKHARTYIRETRRRLPGKPKRLLPAHRRRSEPICQMSMCHPFSCQDQIQRQPSVRYSGPAPLGQSSLANIATLTSRTTISLTLTDMRTATAMTRLKRVVKRMSAPVRLRDMLTQARTTLKRRIRGSIKRVVPKRVGSSPFFYYLMTLYL